MADKIVAVAKDPVKERLRAVKDKLRAKQPGKDTLTQREIEDALEDILNHLGLN